MEVYSGLTLSEDGVVSGCWSECASSILLGKIRDSVPGDELDDIFVIARLAHRVFSERKECRITPVFGSSSRGNTSTCLEMMRIADVEDWDAFERASDEDIVSGVNIARWILRLPQQTSSPIVFVEGPRAIPSPRKQARSRVAS